MGARVLFRADANKSIGRGHLSRCVAIADMLKENFDVSLICLEENRIYIQSLSINFSVKYISKEEDIFALANLRDIVWIDGYNFSEAYKKRLRKKVYKLIETNDIPYEAKNVDVILNHTPAINKNHFGNTNAALYLGLKYSILRRTFLDHATKNTEEKKNTGKGVFICFGGADTYNLGEKFVSALLDRGFTLPIYWVSNKISNSYDFSSDHLFILNNLSEQEMIYYMQKSKVLIIPSSILSFEAIALRKPFFTCYFVDNQKLIFEGLKELNLAECFGFAKEAADVSMATDRFLNFYKDKHYQSQIIEKQRIHLDGNSKEYICNILLEN